MVLLALLSKAGRYGAAVLEMFFGCGNGLRCVLADSPKCWQGFSFARLSPRSGRAVVAAASPRALLWPCSARPVPSASCPGQSSACTRPSSTGGRSCLSARSAGTGRRAATACRCTSRPSTGTARAGARSHPGCAASSQGSAGWCWERRWLEGGKHPVPGGAGLTPLPEAWQGASHPPFNGSAATGAPG